MLPPSLRVCMRPQVFTHKKEKHTDIDTDTHIHIQEKEREGEGREEKREDERPLQLVYEMSPRGPCVSPLGPQP